VKRELLTAILGLAVAPVAFGQGHLLISNYIVSPYNQVYWGSSVPGVANQAMNDTSVILTLWYGEGVITDPSQLAEGVSFTVLTSGGPERYNPGYGRGPGGYYLAPEQILSSWQPGDTFTFQIRASGNTSYGPVDPLSRSALWTESAMITSAANPAEANTFSAGLAVQVPEPTTVSLVGASLVSLVFCRRSSLYSTSTSD
jgi:hypothetical protein